MNQFQPIETKNIFINQDAEPTFNEGAMEKIKKLDILIIVFNQELLCSRIIKNIESYITDEINVLIQDDCSTDRTYEILSKFFQNNKNVKVFRTEKNMGPNGNLIKLIEHASAEYLIMLGGDDFINQREIQNILEILRCNEFDIGVFNCAHATLETIDHLIFGGPRLSERLKIDIRNNNLERINVQNTNIFFEKIATMPGSLWLQGVIIKTELMKIIPKMKSSNVDDWGIIHNLAVYNINQKLIVKQYENFITTLTHMPNSRGTQIEMQLNRQLSAVVKDWHPLFRKKAFYNVIEKKMRQLENLNIEIDEVISLMNRSFFELKKSIMKIK